MNLRKILYSLTGGHISFPNGLYGLQAPVERHVYMKAMVKKYCLRNPDRPLLILEVGSWIGSSALTWFDAMDSYGNGGRLVCSDMWKPYFEKPTSVSEFYPRPVPNDVTLAMNLSLDLGIPYEIFRYNLDVAGYGDRVTTIIGDSRETLPILAPGAFDIVYIDGNHAYSTAKADIVNAKKLVRPGGIVCGDDLELAWSQCDQDYARERLEGDQIGDPRHRIGFHPGVSLAVDEEFGEVSSWYGFWAVQNMNGWSNIVLEGEKLDMPRYIPATHQNHAENFLAKMNAGL